MSREAMQMALEALETVFMPHHPAVIALREWLVQPEQEPVAWISEGGDVSRSKRYMDEMGFKCNPLYTSPPQRELTCVCGAVWEGEMMVHPPRKREWVSLTDEEMRECAQAMDAEPVAEGWTELIKLARYIEAKLKEKNT